MPRLVKARLPSVAFGGIALPMSENSKSLSREERLAAKLRENLRRRKAQSRAVAARGQAARDTLPKQDEPG